MSEKESKKEQVNHSGMLVTAGITAIVAAAFLALSLALCSAGAGGADTTDYSEGFVLRDAICSAAETLADYADSAPVEPVAFVGKPPFAAEGLLAREAEPETDEGEATSEDQPENAQPVTDQVAEEPSAAATQQPVQSQHAEQAPAATGAQPAVPTVPAPEPIQREPRFVTCQSCGGTGLSTTTVVISEAWTEYVYDSVWDGYVCSDGHVCHSDAELDQYLYERAQAGMVVTSSSSYSQVVVDVIEHPAQYGEQTVPCPTCGGQGGWYE